MQLVLVANEATNVVNVVYRKNQWEANEPRTRKKKISLHQRDISALRDRESPRSPSSRSKFAHENAK